MRTTLGRKAVGIIVVISVAIALGVGAGQVVLENLREQREMSRRFDTIGESMLEGIANSLWVMDREQLEIQLEGVFHVGDIAHVELRVDESGEVITRGRKPANGSPNRVYDLTRAFHGSPIHLARLEVTADGDVFRARLVERLTVDFSGLVVMTFVIAMLFLLVVRRMITEPLERLAAHANALEPGNLDTPPPPLERPLGAWPDEIDDLAHAMRVAQDRLRESSAALARANQTLENRVAERTRELEESERRHRELFERNKAVSLLIDPASGAIIDANLAAAAYYGHSRDRLASMNIADINILSPEEIRSEMENAVREKRSRFDFRHMLASGEVRDVEVHSGPIAIDGRTILFSIVHDVTDRRQAEANLQKTMDRLIESNQELERFAHVASHDLQEPVRTVTMYAQLLSKRYGDRLDSDAAEFLGFVVSGAKRMGTLVRDLLTFSRVESNASQFGRVDMNRVLNITHENLRLLIEETGTRVDGDVQLPVVTGDETQLAELLQNLFSNAIKFRAPDRTPVITLEAVTKGEACTISVGDNGIGIDPAYFDQIFVIFKRLHTASAYPGTGIGLAVCRRIVERHGGRIWVESVPGRGTVFHFTLSRFAKGTENGAGYSSDATNSG